MCDDNITLKRFQALVDKEKSRDVIAKAIKCNTSTITKHYNGDRTISTEYIIKYSKYFNVSADYLLGLSDVATMDKDIKYICDYTGLSEKAVEKLNDYKLYSEFYKHNMTDKEFVEMVQVKKELDVVKSSVTVLSREYKDYLFILNSLITTGASEFDNIIKGIAEYIKNNANLKVPPMEYMLHIVMSSGNVDLENFDNDRIQEARELEQKDFNDYKLYTLSKRLKNAADLIANDYIKFRGTYNGND